MDDGHFGTKKFLKKILVTKERGCVSLYCNRNRYIIYPKLNYSQVKCLQILRFDSFICLFKLQLLFWYQASVLHLALPPLAICYTLIGTQAIFRMLFHSRCWIPLQQLQNASQTCHATCLFFPSSHCPSFPYENNLAGVIPSLLAIKICMHVWAGPTFNFFRCPRSWHSQWGVHWEKFTEAPLPCKTLNNLPLALSSTPRQQCDACIVDCFMWKSKIYIFKTNALLIARK